MFRLATSVLLSFVKFLQSNQYSTSMWEKGYSPNESNEVCHRLTEWAQNELDSPGEFVMMWATLDDITFCGDSELAYTNDGNGYLVPNPFIEGDAEGFTAALQLVLQNQLQQLYTVQVNKRILFNAI